MKKMLSCAAAILSAFAAQAQCNELFITEYLEGSRNNKAIEIYNPTGAAIDLSQYRFTRWQNGSSTWSSQYSDALSGTIQPKDAIVLVLDRRDTTKTGVDTPVVLALRAKADLFLSADYNTSYSMSFNGDDALSLDKNNGSGTYLPVDIFGRIGERPTNANGTTSSPVGGWTDQDPFNSGQGVFWTTGKTLYRKANIEAGITTNPSKFNPTLQWDTLPSNVYMGLGVHYCNCNTDNRIGFTGFDNQSTYNSFDSTLPIRVIASRATTVDVVAVGGTATQGTDYQFTSKNINLNGQILTQFRVKLLDAGAFSGTRTIVLALRNPGSGASIGNDSLYTITLQGTGSSTGIGNVNKNKASLVVYPNPASNNQELTVSSSQPISAVEIIDAYGRVVRTEEYNTRENQAFISTGDLSRGIYYIRVKHGSSQTSSTRFVIK